MERFKHLLRQTEFHVLLFCVSLVLFGWPVVNFSDMQRLEIRFIYLFLAWGVVILLLYLVGRSLGEPAAPEETEDGRK
jgi:hypothetical protein